MATANRSHTRKLDKCQDTNDTPRPMYRPSKRPPKGAWSRHLQEQRRVRDLSAVEAFELVFERIGWSRKSRTAYVAIDSGDRQPKGIEVTVLGAEFGWPSAADAEPEPVGETDALVAALREQTAAIDRLVSRLDAMAMPAIRAGVADALREAGLGRAIEASQGAQPSGHQL
jgi:hypothetical protein